MSKLRSGMTMPRHSPRFQTIMRAFAPARHHLRAAQNVAAVVNWDDESHELLRHRVDELRIMLLLYEQGERPSQA
jgi:hypothetical protein